MRRREFLGMLAAASAAGILPGSIAARQKSPSNLYELPSFGDVRLLHFTDSHAQLTPIYFREPSVNLGIGAARGRPPHLVGEHLLGHYGITDAALAHAFTFLDFAEAAEIYGRVGGFAHLRALVTQLRESYGVEKTLLMDGGDTWQGSGTALWTRGADMVGASNLLGVDLMTGHWEFTYDEEEIRANLEAFRGEFLAQNVLVTEDALFEDAPVFDEESGHAFRPYSVRELGGKRVAVIGQAFPYTPIANPSRFIPNWTFGVRPDQMQALVDKVREAEQPSAVVLLSHNGMDVDLKLASMVRGIDVILGGHTHDGVPAPSLVENGGGTTLVTNAGSNGKFLAVLDLELGEKKVRDYRYRLLPVFSNLIEPDSEMSEYIARVRAPYLDQLNETLAVADSLLYRRGNFNGTFDQVVCDALRAVNDAEIALSPGFRWGTTVLPGQPVTMAHVLDQTAITYPETYVREMSGEELKLILEDVADNLFNTDPFFQQGGDMVRLGGLDYVLDPTESIGHRISDMTLNSGKPVEAGKTYKVTGWATVGAKSSGPPVWETVADYLRGEKTVNLTRLNTPKLKNVDDNPGMARG